MGEWGEGILTKHRKIYPADKVIRGDTDSIMTDVNTTQNQKQRETPANFAKKEPSENVAQQLPNTDPESTETNNWPNQEWDNAERNGWTYYYWTLAMVYGENDPETQEKEKKRGKQIGAAKTKYTYSTDL